MGVIVIQGIRVAPNLTLFCEEVVTLVGFHSVILQDLLSY